MKSFSSILVAVRLAAATALPRAGTACGSLTAPTVENATVTSIAGIEKDDICQVTVYLTHDGASDNVSISTWLPITNWNGRYQGTGGAGFSAGVGTGQLSSPASEGYAAGTTDAGLPAGANSTNYASDPQLQKNFAYLSIHDMTVVGKALAAQFYGTPVSYSYWNGCSTGGRQGYMAAQKYPEDYNGIYAASAPLNYGKFETSRLWPYVVQNQLGEFVDECVFDTLTDLAISACDIDDGALDGLISNPPACQFDATEAVGLATTSCANNTTITDLQAEIFNMIARGPTATNGTWLYFGIAKGASYATIAGATPYADALGFTKAWVLHDPDFDISQVNFTTFPAILDLAYDELNDLIGTWDPDLAPFRDAGGKLLSWHGWADPNIYANETATYWLNVRDALDEGNGDNDDDDDDDDDDDAVKDFYRLFLAPGVGHCGGGYGAAPTDPFGALVAWVENGTVPETLAAEGNGITRDLCAYPLELQYSGSGNVSLASSWGCA
ncbi:feruloyl esterase B [Xylariales sp. PMI_506]|nr:feruloyl esterase B [Xylariales sp. PMI_506]